MNQIDFVVIDDARDLPNRRHEPRGIIRLINRRKFGSELHHRAEQHTCPGIAVERNHRPIMRHQHDRLIAIPIDRAHHAQQANVGASDFGVGLTIENARAIRQGNLR